MSKKRTIEEVRASFEAEGYTLISTEYIEAHSKLSYLCPEGHSHSISWSKWSQGRRCFYCHGKIKLSIEQVRASFEQESYVLLSTEYKDSKSRLKYMCPNGHERDTTWDNWNLGKRCLQCSNSIKPTIEQVRDSFASERYTLLTTEYVNAHTKLDYVCPEGHKHSIKWNKWQQGYRCYYCFGTIKHTYEFIYNEFKKENYTLISTEYINAKTKLDYICDKGHKHSMEYSSWKNGNRCPSCAGTLKFTYDEVYNYFNQKGYILVSTEYINTQTKLDYICPNGHAHSMQYNNFRTGQRCPTCALVNRSGPGHYNWIKDRALKEYCEAWRDEEYKADIRERDGNRCLNPYCASEHPEDLNIHHINYDKKDCHPKNLITVCRSCNSKANTDRAWHQSWYQSLLHNRYGYKYT